jgi:hypothetical protein
MRFRNTCRGAGLVDSEPEAGDGTLEHRVGVGRGERRSPRADSRHRQEILDQALHPDRAVHGERDELVGIAIELPPVALGQ